MLNRNLSYIYTLRFLYKYVRHNKKPPMIKTNYKSKIGKEFTHSLGSKRISELLNGIDIYDNLSISFDKSEGGKMGLFVPGWNLRYLKGNSKKLLDFKTLISGIYSTVSDKWFINLKPVHISENKSIKPFLVNIGIPVLRNWFKAEKSESWYAGHRSFQIGINEKMTEYCVLETQNDLVINKRIEKITVPNTV